MLSECLTSRYPLPSSFHLCDLASLDLFGWIAEERVSFVSFSLFYSSGCWCPIPGAAHPSNNSSPSSASPVWSSDDREWGASSSCCMDISCLASAALQKYFLLHFFHNYLPFKFFFPFCSILSVSSGLEPFGILRRKHELIFSGEGMSSLQFASLGGVSCPLAFNKLHRIKEWLWIRVCCCFLFVVVGFLLFFFSPEF